MNLSSRVQTHNIDEVIVALSSGTHRAGTLCPAIIKGILELLPSRDIFSVETGCGKSTIAFSNIAKHHIAFCYDDRDMEESSVNYVLAHRHFVPDRASFVFGPTQVTLPQYDFGDSPHFDLVLIDGPHGYPFPDLEYWHLYPRIAAGGLLVIDDLMIPSIGRMYDVLREDRMFEEVAVLGTTGILRRSHEPPLPRDGDHWWEQAYNFRQFPITMQPYRKNIAYVLGSEADLSNSEVFKQYCARGFEFRPGNGAATIDTSAVLHFSCGAQSGAPLRLRFRFRITSVSDCVGGSVHANGMVALELPAHSREVDVELPCFADSNGDCRVEFRLPAAKPIHDTKGNLNFRRAGLTLRQFSACADDNQNRRIVFHAGAPIEGFAGNLAAMPPSGDALNAADFISTIRRLHELCGFTCSVSASPREITPAPILCPNATSAVRFLPLRGANHNEDLKRLGRMLPLGGKNWTFVDFFAFEGEEFSYAVFRSLLHRAPNNREVQIGIGNVVDKLFLVLDADYRARKTGGLGRFKDFPRARALYRLWRVFQKYKLGIPAAGVRRLIERTAQTAYRKNRRALNERRLLLKALTSLSDKWRAN
jgi:hypothetical protein